MKTERNTRLSLDLRLERKSNAQAKRIIREHKWDDVLGEIYETEHEEFTAENDAVLEAYRILSKRSH